MPNIVLVLSHLSFLSLFRYLLFFSFSFFCFCALNLTVLKSAWITMLSTLHWVLLTPLMKLKFVKTWRRNILESCFNWKNTIAEKRWNEANFMAKPKNHLKMVLVSFSVLIQKAVKRFSMRNTIWWRFPILVKKFTLFHLTQKHSGKLF